MNEKILAGLIGRLQELHRTAGEGLSEYRVELFEHCAAWWKNLSSESKTFVSGQLSPQERMEYSRMRITLKDGYVG